MIKELGCTYVLIGHSERRAILNEDLALLAKKFMAALDAGLTPILCVGETLEQRKAGQTESIIFKQVESVIQAAGINAFKSKCARSHFTSSIKPCANIASKRWAMR